MAQRRRSPPNAVAPVPLPPPQRGGITPEARHLRPSNHAAPGREFLGFDHRYVQQNDAANISQQVFGSPRIVEDDAYGAYQRGAYLTALEFALPRAQNNDHAAQTLIGEIYSQGLGVAQDNKKAAGWFDIASRHGDMLAAFQLAVLYQTGSGVPKDGKKAVALFKQAADSGYAPAKYNLALLYVQGMDVAPDLVKAAALMKDAADSGLSDAQYDYGSMLMEGGGVPIDEKQGAIEIGLAAQAGNMAAQVDYATLLYLGKGVSSDLAGAVRWYKQAADGGNPVAEKSAMQSCSLPGEGVDLDLEVRPPCGAPLAAPPGIERRQGLDKLLVSDPRCRTCTQAEERARFWPSTAARRRPAAGSPMPRR